MRTCQTAANEFLRQFWHSIYPPSNTPLAAQTPAQKAAKAKRMAEYLARTPEKVTAIVREAQVTGVDRTRVEAVRSLYFVRQVVLMIGTSVLGYEASARCRGQSPGILADTQEVNSIRYVTPFAFYGLIFNRTCLLFPC